MFLFLFSILHISKFCLFILCCLSYVGLISIYLSSPCFLACVCFLTVINTSMFIVSVKTKQKYLSLKTILAICPLLSVHRAVIVLIIVFIIL